MFMFKQLLVKSKNHSLSFSFIFLLRCLNILWKCYLIMHVVFLPKLHSLNFLSRKRFNFHIHIIKRNRRKFLWIQLLKYVYVFLIDFRTRQGEGERYLSESEFLFRYILYLFFMWTTSFYTDVPQYPVSLF